MFQTSTEVAYDFYHQQSGVLWQILLDHCRAILSASGDGATVNKSELRKGGGAQALQAHPRSVTDFNTVSGQTYFPAKF